MKNSFILSCESTVDLPYSYVHERDLSVLFYTYTVDDEEYLDDMGRNTESLPKFYRFLMDGKKIGTSQINVYQYTDYFEKLLKKGDVLHISFGSGMTPSVKNAEFAAEQLRELDPNKNIQIIDSLCSSSGYGLLVDVAADMRDRGCSMEEIKEWLLENRNKVHHQFFSTDLTYYRKSGRMSGAAAMVGTILSICPIMHLNQEGRIIAYDKVRGKKNAIRETIRTMEQHAQNGTKYSGKCFICHSNCFVEAQETKNAVENHFPKLEGKVRICDIGTIIASHSGPGTVAVFFFGDERM